MGKIFDGLDDELIEFIRDQRLFFVATAPLARDGHVNVSPKGHDHLRVLDRHRLAYLDLTGSGAETIAHARENGRICLMFCAFSGRPRIVRVHGSASVVMPTDPAFAELISEFDPAPHQRCIIVIEARRIADSCGYSVPRYEYVGERTQLTQWAERKGDEGLSEYRREKNQLSLDGLPAIDFEELD